MKYDPASIEQKWQDKWEKDSLYKTTEDSAKPKFYVLDMFPYPSGEGLHVGHPKGYIATDVVSRMKRMQGFNVLHPMGFDAFGLPAENYAIKMKTNPAIAVAENVARYKKQLEILGFDYDWSREINTTDPKYYKWTQWIFLKLFEKGLAHEAYEPINWCPVDKTGLANEDIEDGKCERCGAVVEKRMMKQWVLKITDYADRLLADLDAKGADGKLLLDWPESIKESQRNWIGRSEGTEIDFTIKGAEEKIKVFTTRPDTLFGVTYVVLAPEHSLVQELLNSVSNKAEVEAYVAAAKAKSEIDRTDATKAKTGVELKGITAINPANNEEVPVWIADYVLADYGTGAVMAVPAHDERDFAFAKSFNLKVERVFTIPWDPKYSEGKVVFDEDKNYKLNPDCSEGFLINSGEFNGQKSDLVRNGIAEKFGKKVVKYKLRDWVFSRQRYWGEPIPVLHDKDGKIIPVAEKDLPVTLPKVDHYEPTDTGESPLANISEWVNVSKGLIRKESFTRETNTMPQWAGSSWYYLRYMDVDNDKALVDPAKEKYWNEVDLYVGGAEHATRHLIYARFWHKFLFDIGVVSTIEPFKKLQSVGLIMASDGRKMSKRWGNVINPDDIVKNFGADSLRLYEMFMGPFDQAIAWNTDGLVGTRRFVERVWRLKEKVKESSGEPKKEIETLIHQTIKKVSEDIAALKFNTAVSQLMIALNALEKESEIAQPHYETVLQLLAPFAPHVTEELWNELGHRDSVHSAPWPAYDLTKLVPDTVSVAVQVNGKTREIIEVPQNSEEETVKEAALASEGVKKWVEGKSVKKVIWVKNKILNLLVD